MSYTKGDWELYEGNNFSEVQIKKPYLKSICAINSNIEEHRKNAKLIACAPEMFELLVSVLETISDEYSNIKDNIELLINKAT